MRDLDHYLDLFEQAETVGPNLIARAAYAAIEGDATSASANDLAPFMRALPAGASFTPSRARTLTAALLLHDAAEELNPDDHLRAARELLDWTQQEAADAIDVDRVSWARWESADSRPNDTVRSSLEALANHLSSPQNTSNS